MDNVFLNGPDSSNMSSERSLAEDVSDLIRTLESLQRELEPGDRRRLRPPTPRELRRFTTEVTIPAAILVLETNVHVLKLLQRALRQPEFRETGRRGSPPLSERITGVASDALDRLDDTVASLQNSPAQSDGDVAELLDEARRLQSRIEDELESAQTADTDSVSIDVEAELESIKDDIDEDGAE